MRLSAWIALVSLVVLLVAGAVPARPAAAGPLAPAETIRIAVLVPLSGAAVSFGTGARDGAGLAFEQQNGRGGLLGRTIATVLADTACSAAGATAAGQSVIDQGVKFIIGDVCSSGSIALAALANDAGVLQVTPASTNEGVTVYPDGRTRPYTFRACFTDPVQGWAAARFAYATLRAVSAFVLVPTGSAYGEGLASAFGNTAAGLGMRVGSAGYTAPDFAGVLGLVAAARPDVVYLPDFYGAANQIIPQARARGITATFLGGDGWDSSQLNFAAADGSYFTNHYTNESTRPQAVAFRQAFAARFGHQPDAVAALAYDAAGLIFQAIRETNSLDPAVVKDRLAVLSFEGVTGVLTFDARHNPQKSVAMLKVRNGGAYFAANIDPVIAARPTVVLLHGWQGLGSRQYRCADGITPYPVDQNFAGENPSDIGDLADWLHGEGFEVWSAHVDTGPGSTASLHANAVCLSDQLAQVQNHAPGGKLILIADSMGGLVARAYVEDPTLYHGNVKTLFTLGAPHTGVPVEAGLWLARLLDLRGLDPAAQVGLSEFVEGSADFNRQYGSRNPEVTYYALSGDLPLDRRSALGLTLAALIEGADDGIVPASSGGALPGACASVQTHESHAALLGDYSYFTTPPGDRRSLAYEDCIRPVLAGDPDGCHGAMVDTVLPPEFGALAPIAVGEVAAGTVATYTVGLDGGAALFAATWATGILTFTLAGPGGLVVDPAYAAAHPGVAAYRGPAGESGALAAGYVITAAVSGPWTLALEAGPSPAGSRSYALLVATDSPVTLTVAPARAHYGPGETVLVSAQLPVGLPAAQVEVEIRPDGHPTSTLSLVPAGGGRYSAAFGAPAAAGYVTLAATAAGSDGEGRPYARAAAAGFQVTAGTAVLSGVYGSALAPRPPFPALSQALTVTVGITAHVSSTFGLAADLEDATGHFVAHGVTVADLVTGTGTLALRFRGDDLWAGGRDGPYTLTHLLLTDQRGALVVAAEADAVYTTPAYTYRSFRNPATVDLPHLRR